MYEYRLLLSVKLFSVVFGPRCMGGGMLCEFDSSTSPFGTVEALGSLYGDSGAKFRDPINPHTVRDNQCGPGSLMTNLVMSDLRVTI